MQAFGAQLEPQGSGSLQRCMNFCETRSDCLAIDFRRVSVGDQPNGGCYPHYDPDDLLRVSSTPNLDYYFKSSCVGTGDRMTRITMVVLYP